MRRAIDIPEGSGPDAAAFKELILAAIAFNTAAQEKRAAAKNKPKA